MNEKELLELDAWIAEHVMGIEWAHDWKRQGRRKCKCEKCGHVQWNGSANRCDCYTTDSAAVMQVLERCIDWKPVIEKFDNGNFYVWSIKDAAMEFPEAPTLELAICLFAKALFSKL